MNYKYLKFSSIKRMPSLLVLLILISFVFIWPVPPFAKNKATLIIDFGDKKRVFEGKTFKDMTVLDALNTSANAGNIEFSYAISGDSINIGKIDSYSTDTSKFLFFLNSSLIDSNQINKIKIKPGDEIKIKTR